MARVHHHLPSTDPLHSGTPSSLPVLNTHKSTSCDCFLGISSPGVRTVWLFALSSSGLRVPSRWGVSEPQSCLWLSNTPWCPWTSTPAPGLPTTFGSLCPWCWDHLLTSCYSPTRLCLPHVLRQGLCHQSSDGLARAEDPARGEWSVEQRVHAQL